MTQPDPARSKTASLLLALAMAAGAGCGLGHLSTRVPTPPLATATVSAWLDAPYGAPLPGPPEVASLIFTFRQQGLDNAFTLRRLTTARLVPQALRVPRPAHARQAPGLYMGVFDPAEAAWRYLVPISDPRIIVGEGAGPGGTLSTTVIDRGWGSLATRLPFLPGWKVTIFETGPAPGTLSVHLLWTLPADLPAAGRHYRVAKAAP